MADEKYSIDDILKEIDTSRTGKAKKRTSSDSVTEIIDGGDEIDRLIRSGKQQKRTDYSVTEVINSVGKQREPIKSAKQRTDSEVEKRIAKDVAKAADNKKSAAPEPDVREFAAKQRTEDEVNARIAKDVSYAADMKRWEDLSEPYEQEDDDDIKTYSPESQRNSGYVRATVSEDSTEIELHDAATFVPSDTMELRRQKKLAEFRTALLKLDSESENPNDILDSLNPMETREKAAAELNVDEDTDTLTVSGNDLKTIGKGEERIKEYTPSASRKRERIAEEKPEEIKPAPFTGELHVGESIIEALNKKINEQSSDLPGSEDLNIASPDSVKRAEPEENEELEKIKQANELAKKKKRKLAEFIIEGRSDTEETDKITDKTDYTDEETEEEDDETPVDLNDEEVIRDRLGRASKGLWSRLIILLVLFAASVFVAAVNIFGLEIGRLGRMLSYVTRPDNYLYVHLGIGIFSFLSCSSVVSNGFSRMLKLRPDGDTLCALAHTGAIIAIIPYLYTSRYIQLGFAQIYLVMSLASMIFNTISKMFTVNAALKNFKLVFGSKSKYFIEHCEGSGAEQLAKGVVEGMPAVASIRKTEMLCDFIVSTYSEDSSDRTSRRIVPIALAAALAGGVAAYFTCRSPIPGDHASWAATVSSAILAISASFSSSMTVTLPIYLASRKSKQRGCAILGYAAAEEMSETNAVLVNAKMLFPADSIKIVNICGYDTPKTRGEGKINIDEAIIYASSLAIAADSVMSDALFHILNYKKELLKPVSGCVYENNLGVMGWIDRRRVLLGTRAHMKAHEITVPNTKKEAAANKNNDEVIYLAVGGEVCLLFFVRPTADPEIRRSVRELAFRGISLVVKTVDGMITAPVTARTFGIDEDNVKILPFEMHDTFDENTKFISDGSAAVTSDGSFSSLSYSVVTSRAIRDRAAIGNIMQMIGVVLAISAFIVFALISGEDQLRKFNLFNVFWMLLYNAVWGALTLGVQFFRKM